MRKAVLISIRPAWCQKIANGEKTIEVRKNRPKLAPPFKCYIYCTQAKYPHEDFIETEYQKPHFTAAERSSESSRARASSRSAMDARAS